MEDNNFLTVKIIKIILRYYNDEILKKNIGFFHNSVNSKRASKILFLHHIVITLCDIYLLIHKSLT